MLFYRSAEAGCREHFDLDPTTSADEMEAAAPAATPQSSAATPSVLSNLLSKSIQSENIRFVVRMFS